MRSELTLHSKANVTNLMRHFIQFLFLLISPGLFVVVFSEIKQVYLAVLKGTPLYFNSNFYMLIIVLISTILLGRYFCGWMCSFGAISEWFYKIFHMAFKFELKIPPKVDKILRFTKYVLLVLMLAFIWPLGINLASINPWDSFANLISFSLNVALVGTIILLIITVLNILFERFFCRFLCPLGAVFGILSKLNILSIRKKNSKCNFCTSCPNKCQMDIKTYNAKLNSSECIKCFECIEGCPTLNYQLNIASQTVNPQYTSILTIAGIISLFSILNMSSFKGSSNTSNTATSVSNIISQEIYNAQEGSPKQDVIANNSISPSVTVEKDDISNNQSLNSIQEKSNNQDTVNEKKTNSENLQKDTSTLKNDSDSNDTSTSQNKLLNNTSEKKTTKENSNSTENNSPSEAANTTNVEIYQDNTKTIDNIPTVNENSNKSNNTQVETSKETTSTVSKIYKDGTYTGEGFGYHPGLIVEVTIKDDKITRIEIVSHRETPEFAQLPLEVIPQEIIENQSTNVDIVSGATRTSYGIMMAVEDALNKAKIENNQ